MFLQTILFPTIFMDLLPKYNTSITSYLYWRGIIMSLVIKQGVGDTRCCMLNICLDECTNYIAAITVNETPLLVTVEAILCFLNFFFHRFFGGKNNEQLAHL